MKTKFSSLARPVRLADTPSRNCVPAEFRFAHWSTLDRCTIGEISRLKARKSCRARSAGFRSDPRGAEWDHGGVFCLSDYDSRNSRRSPFLRRRRLSKGVKAIVNMSQISARRNRKKSRSAKSLDRRAPAGSFGNIRPLICVRIFFAEWLMYQSAVRSASATSFPCLSAKRDMLLIAAEDQGRIIATILDAILMGTCWKNLPALRTDRAFPVPDCGDFIRSGRAENHLSSHGNRSLPARAAESRH